MGWFGRKKVDDAPLYQGKLQRWACFYPDFNKKTLFYESRVKYLFVTKYYHEKRLDKNSFMYHLTYIGKVVGDKRLSEFKRVLYEYKSETMMTHKFDNRTQLDWVFPDYYSKTFNLSVRGFEFTFPNLSSSLKTFFEPSQNLINSKTGTEETASVPTQATFFLS